MKALNHSQSINQPLQCESYSTLTPSVSRRWSLLACWLGAVKMKVKSLRLQSATLLTRITPTVSGQLTLRRLSQNKRYVAGSVGLVAGVIAIFAGPLFFNPSVYDHAPCELFGLTNQCFSFETRSGWCFMSWYILFENTKVWIAFIIASLSGFFLIPKQFSGRAFVFFSITGAIGWMNLLHIIGFARSHETFMTFNWAMEWPVLLSACVMAVVGIALSNQAMTYWEHHKKRGNWQRFAGLAEMNLPAEQKEPLYKQLAKEYREVNQMI